MRLSLIDKITDKFTDNNNIVQTFTGPQTKVLSGTWLQSAQDTRVAFDRARNRQQNLLSGLPKNWRKVQRVSSELTAEQVEAAEIRSQVFAQQLVVQQLTRLVAHDLVQAGSTAAEIRGVVSCSWSQARKFQQFKAPVPSAADYPYINPEHYVQTWNDAWAMTEHHQIDHAPFVFTQMNNGLWTVRDIV